MKKSKIILLLFLSIIYFVGCTTNVIYITLIHNENVTKLEVEEGHIFEYGEIYEEGYLFYGWFNEQDEQMFGANIKEDMTIYGKYIKEGTKYKINYILNGGELRVYAPLEYEVGKVTELVKPLPVGTMKFLGWYINGVIVTEIDESYYNDITVEAKWEDYNIYHTIEYVLNGGTISTDYITKFIEGVTNSALPIPKKDGYLFKGWYTDEQYQNRIISINNKITSDLKLYAKFEEYKDENITISFLGDSITTYYSYIPEGYPSYYPTQGCDVNTVEKTWWHLVLENTKYNLLMNNSYSGSKVTSGEGCGQSPERIDNLLKNNESPDIVVIYMGTNDLTHRINVNTFKEGYLDMIDLIREKCDDVIIYVLNIPSMKHQGFLEERIKFNNVISTIAEEKDLILVDIASLITEENYNQYLFAGGHPNALGMKIISDEVIKIINENK